MYEWVRSAVKRFEWLVDNKCESIYQTVLHQYFPALHVLIEQKKMKPTLLYPLLQKLSPFTLQLAVSLRFPSYTHTHHCHIATDKAKTNRNSGIIQSFE